MDWLVDVIGSVHYCFAKDAVRLGMLLGFTVGAAWYSRQYSLRVALLLLIPICHVAVVCITRPDLRGVRDGNAHPLGDYRGAVVNGVSFDSLSCIDGRLS